MQFKKGQSGNPGGRPKVVTEVIKNERLHFGEVLEALREIALDKDEKAIARISAAHEWCDRVVGKAKQTIDIRDIPKLSEEELRSLVEEAIVEMKAENETPANGKPH